ncbi:beta-phosphoglucomutase [Marinigracilibium pacificum]|uniref:Beta-phosphoglucomutase n=1 Tax=Marinigracilibium pacificum TaxID=2729599 RepID=A0A848J3A2_9BACT|nr:beta-phosphoglucomutase [Marinigracilibium pacificum]NMM49985.1 beta-phosphoglucomutase [Marinigracilibium pacificum]
MEVKACIFDLDGVIVDTAKYHYLAWKRLAEELGINFTEEDNEELKGVSRMDSLDIILKKGNKEISQERKDELAAKKNDWYLEFVNEMTPGDELPGTLDFLKTLKQNDIKIGLGSSSKNAKLCLTLLDMMDFFDVIVDGTMITKAKPDPQIFLMGAEQLGVAVENTIVFEDAVAGIEAAQNGGFLTVGIGNPDVLNKATIVKPSLAEVTIKELESLK